MTSFHVSNFGAFAGGLPADLDGYCHLTAEEWLAAPMDAMSPLDQWSAEALAESAREATEAAETSLAEWREQNA
jgi:hypothetical protein